MMREPIRVMLPVSVLAAFLCLGAMTAASADGEVPLPAPGFEVSTERSDPGRPTRPFREPYRGDIVGALTHVDPSQIGGKSKGKNLDSVVDQVVHSGVKTAIF